MMTPQLTEQYGQVDRVSDVRAILSSRTCAEAAVRSKPSADTATPVAVDSFKNWRRLWSIS
jgi:hypothetical protein